MNLQLGRGEKQLGRGDKNLSGGESETIFNPCDAQNTQGEPTYSVQLLRRSRFRSPSPFELAFFIYYDSLEIMRLSVYCDCLF